MKRIVLLIVLLFATSVIFSQEAKRIEVKGKIIVDRGDKEGVTVYNSSSNKGTITDGKGEFVIHVALNDKIEFVALQFKDFDIVIDKNVITSKQITVILVEHVNKLDEVLILPYDLTGNIDVDVESVKTFNPNMDAIYFGIHNIEEFEFSDDHKSRTENIAMHSQGQTMMYGVNIVNIVGLLLKPLFKSTKIKETNVKSNYPYIPIHILKEQYSVPFLHENFGIPSDEIDPFVLYLEDHGLDYNLLELGKELEFLEFISQKSKLYLEKKSDKN
jgi:hypothetical protein